LQIPFLEGFQFKYLIGVMTVICALTNLYPIFSVIFTGGVGKNGSTVAVSWIDRLLVGVMTFENENKDVIGIWHGMRSEAELNY
jgi:acetate kinase